MQSYDYTIKLIKRQKKSIYPFWGLNGPLFVNKKKHTKKTHKKNHSHTHTHKQKQNSSPLCTSMFCAKFGRNWPIGSGEEDFLNFGHVIFLFRYMCINSPWKNACHFIWITTQGCFVQRFFFKWTQEFSFVIFFRYHIPLNKPGSHSANDALCQVWLKSSL